MTTDVGSTSYSETDNSNSNAPPAGWPAGMNGSQVEPTGRAMMGAIKRLYGKTNAIYTTAGTTTAYTVTSSGTAEAAYYNGQLYSFVVNATCGTTPSLNWDGLGAINLRKFTNAGTWATLIAGDLLANQLVTARYNSSGGGTFDILSMAFSLQDIVAAIPATPALVRSYCAGLGTSNNTGTPNSKIDVAAGVCADDTNAKMLTLAATTLDCGTTGANGLDTGVLANSTWYHLFVIGKTDGTTALLASTSVSSPTYPSGYTLKRRIASFLTDGSAHIIGFIQNGDNFRWKTPVNNVNAIPGVTTQVTLAVTVPTGIVVFPDLMAFVTAGSAGVNLLLTSLDETNTTPSGTLQNQAAGSAGAASSGTSLTTLHTNTSAQIGYRVSATDAGVTISTFGWRDTRGRDA